MEQEVQIGLTISVKTSRIRPMDEQPQEEIDFHYEVDSAYRIIAANSILTTVCGKDQLKIDFIVESLPIPKRLRHKILPGRRVGEVVDQEPTGKFVRNVQVGILVTFENAEGFADHIKKEIAKARKSQ